MKYNSLKNILVLAFSIFIGVQLSGQSIGVRAGLNYSKFTGPLETGESFGISNGFHFGLNYGFVITDKFAIRTEMLYSQIGSTHKYNSDGYFKVFIPFTDGEEGFMLGNVESNIEISNAYINLPVTANYQLHPKFEVYGGLSFNFLINPVGRGNVRFSPEGKPEEAFRQSLDYRYYKDKANQATFSSGNSRPVSIIYEDGVIDIPRFVGAYYPYTEKDGGAFNWFDIAGLGGVNYYINRGFFMGVRASYGLLDLTRDKMDRSLKTLNADNSFLLRDDYDHNLSFEVSLGFKF